MISNPSKLQNPQILQIVNSTVMSQNLEATLGLHPSVTNDCDHLTKILKRWVEIMITLRLADEKTLRVTNKEKRSLFTNGAKIKYDKIFVL
jgi:hypothetical protein